MPALTSSLFCLAACILWKDFTFAQDEFALEPCSAGQCQRGQYFSAIEAKCIPCPDNFYMDMENHNCSTCRPCMEADINSTKIVLKSCSVVSDAVIRCVQGYFMSKEDGGMEFECLQCRKCSGNEVVKEECSDFQDAVCTASTTTKQPPATHSSEQYFDTGVFIACMVLLAMIIIGIIIYIKQNPHFRVTVRECLQGRCRDRSRRHYDNELLVVE